jgi:hypothetical protein
MNMAKVTMAKAEKALKALKKAYPAEYYGDGAKIVEDFNWSGTTVPFAIIWEEGPYAWAMDASSKLEVAGVWFEPYTSWALSIYSEDSL